MALKKICSNCKNEETYSEIYKGKVCREKCIPSDNSDGECDGFDSKYSKESDCLGVRHHIVQ